MIINASKYFFARSSAGATYFLSTLILVGELGTEDYGLYSLALTSAQTAVAALSLWVGLASTLRISCVQETDSEEFSTIVKLAFFMPLLAMVFLGAFFSLTQIKISFSYQLLCLILCFLIGTHENFGYIINALGKTNLYCYFVLSRYFGSLLFISISIYIFSGDGHYALLSISLSIFLSFAFLYSPFKRAFNLPYIWNRIIPIISPIAQVGLSSSLIFGLWVFTTYINRYALYTLSDAYELGEFSAVTDLLNGPVALLFQVINLTWAPMVVTAFKHKFPDDFRNRAGEYLGVALAVALPGAVALWYVGPGLIGVFAGGELGIGARQLAGWIGLNTIFASCFGVAGLIMMTGGRTKLAMMVTVATLILNTFAALLANDSHEVARNSTLAIGIGAVIMVLISITCFRYLPAFKLVITAVFAAASLLLSAQVAGSELLNAHPFFALTYAVFLSGVLNFLFDSLGIRNEAIHRVSSFLNRSS